MDKPELDVQLAQLHAQLQQATTVDENERELLQTLEADIRDLLAQDAAERTPRYRRLSERLRHAVEGLESSHPTVTMLMGQVVDALAKMGI